LSTARRESEVAAGVTAGSTAAPPTAAPDQVPLKDIRVLIVDDDPDAAEMLSFALSEAGAEARMANSVDEAFSCLSEWVPNMLLSDITMPGEDGYSFIKRLRSRDDTNISGIPAIALTAMARPQDGDRALSSGFQMHMPKPVDLDELTRWIANLARNGATINSFSS
jgi:CheY-like chemotaxis protein